MTVMTIDDQDISYVGDWGREREVAVKKDENNSFGISIVGGTVNVSENCTVSGIFIKNIIPGSPADKCGLLKIGDRILMVDGADIRNSSHEYAMRSIKMAKNEMILLVQSLVNDLNETSTFMKKVPPPVTPCKTPELEVIHDACGKPREMLDKVGENVLQTDGNALSNDIVLPAPHTLKVPITINDNPAQPTTESDNSSDEEDNRDMEGKTFTKAGVEIDRASAGNIKRTKEEIALDTEEEDCFGYTTKKIKKRYGSLGHVIYHTIERSSNESLGISLAGHRNRTKMACFVAGINPKGIASTAPFEVGDEILEVNGIVLHGRSHLNVCVVIKGIVGTTLKIIVLRTKTAADSLAVKPVTHFPVSIENEEDMFADYKNLRVVSIKKGNSGLGIMIIEGKHSEVGQGIFISDIQEGSMAEKAGLNIGEMILSVNRDSLVGCSYETAASVLKKADGVVTLKICNPNKDKAATEVHSDNLDPKEKNTLSARKSPSPTQEPNTANKMPSRPVTPKPQASPAKEIVDPSKAEVKENEYTTLEINTDKSPLGITVVGGNDSQVTTGAVIVDILPSCVACKDKRLQVFDQILEINGIKITAALNGKEIQKAVKQMLPKVRLVVYRPTPEEIEKIEIDLVKKPGKQLGIGFRANHAKGVIITDMLEGSIAEADGRIHKGDIVTHINSESISNISLENCSTVFKTAQGRVALTIVRPKPKTRVL